MHPTQRDTSRSVLSRAFDVLSAFGSNRSELRLREVVAFTGLPKSSAHRLLGDLVELRALERTPNGGFTLGARMFELGSLVPSYRDLRSLALPFMADLYEASHEIVHLAVLDDDELLYIEKIAGHRRTGLPSRVGGRLPPSCTALGKVILAFSPLATQRRVLAKGLPRLTQYSIVDSRVLLEALQRDRVEGVSFEREESRLGVACVAAPILDAERSAIAAISLAGPARRFKPELMAVAVQTASLAVSRAVIESSAIEEPSQRPGRMA